MDTLTDIQASCAAEARECLQHCRHISSARKTYVNYMNVVALGAIGIIIGLSSDGEVETSEHFIFIVTVTLSYVINVAVSSEIHRKSRVIAAYEQMIIRLRSIAYADYPTIEKLVWVRNHLPRFEELNTRPTENSLQNLLPLYRIIFVILALLQTFILLRDLKSSIHLDLLVAFVSALILFHSIYFSIKSYVYSSSGKDHLQKHFSKFDESLFDDFK